ncbi:MAG TPA: hypothetical protein VGE12_06920 [Noviherbaspirillum sp.]
MSNLSIKDLSHAGTLDGKAMAAVRGGMNAVLPADMNQLFNLANNAFNFDASQLLNQSQSTIVANGNNAAFVSSVAAAPRNGEIARNDLSFVA